MANRFIGGVLSSQQPSSGGFVSRASTGTYFNNAGTLVTAPINQPRLNYSFNGNPAANRYSNYFNGTNAYLNISATTTANFGTSTNFTIEAWVYPTSLNSNVFTVVSTTLNQSVGVPANFNINANGTVQMSGGTATSSSVTLNAWNHVAYVRNGTGSNNAVIYINGVAGLTVTDSSNYSNTDGFQVGIRTSSGPVQYFGGSGYISNVRIVRGVAVYTGNFTPPTSPLTATQSSGTNISAITTGQTILLTCQNNGFLDNGSSNFAVTNNNTTISNFIPPTFTPDLTSGTGWYNPTTLIEPASTNLIQYSTAFTNAFWTAYNSYITVTANSATAPDGTTTATTITSATGASQFKVIGPGSITSWITISGAYTYSIFAKAGTSAYASIWAGGSGANFASDYMLYNLITGTLVASTMGTGSSTNIINVGNGWWRITWTSVATAGSNISPLIGIADASATARPGSSTTTGSLYIWGAQFEQGYTATSYIPTNGGTATRAQDDVGPLGSGMYTLMQLENQTSIDDQYIVNTYTLPYYGGYFNGSTSYLSIAQTTSTDLAANNFTLEMWIYFGNTVSNSSVNNNICGKWNSSSQWILQFRAAGADSITNQHWRFYTNNGSGPSTDFQETSTTSVQINTWYHIALVRNGSSFIFYRNGGQVGSTLTSATSIPTSSDTLTIGSAQNNSYSLIGYISNFRLVIGTAVYTSAFTVPTGPLTAITNTILLTLQSSTIFDASSNNFTITNNNVTPSTINVFGSTQYWTAPQDVTSIETLVVAGGGGGTISGGGAGGVIYNASYPVTPGQTYPITIGQGGTGCWSSGTVSQQGGNTSFSNLIAIGGGATTRDQSSGNSSGGFGGSGGGGSLNSTSSGTTYAGSPGVASQGYPGGSAVYWGTDLIGGGGGGSGGPGGPLGTSIADNVGALPNGGPGSYYNISGSLIAYAGGGGGGTRGIFTTAGTGGVGGGGTGYFIGTTPGANATGYGSGGGGGLGGGSGSSGIVITKYKRSNTRLVATSNAAIVTQKFITSNTWIAPIGVTQVEVLVVAGGGGGGYGTSGRTGGGGAGGVVYNSAYSVTPGSSYTVTIGSGGTGSTTNAQLASVSNGSNSVFGTLTALGGGGGANGSIDTSANVVGASGGSGGGGGGSATISNTYSGGSASQPGSGSGGYGNAGGNGIHLYGTWAGGGAGGGAGSVGYSANNISGTFSAPAGGTGLPFTITGNAEFYAGGGGGSFYSGTSYGPGGAGGGGVGNSTGAGFSGAPNTGGGGGAGGNGNGGSGGSGVIIIRYRVPTVATFLDSGSWTCPAGVTSVQALIVAGGGGGGSHNGADKGGGGGGAGGLIYSSSIAVTPGQTYPVVVGQGGAGGVSGSNAPGFNGQNSSFANLIAIGGGGGAQGIGGGPYAGVSGGSGGGGTADGTGSNGAPGAGTYGQGNSSSANTAPNNSAGGGGAGSAGVGNTASTGGTGGAGLTYSISGTSTTYAGGGGGGAYSGTSGSGGSGGGGNAGAQGGNAGVSATANTGGGGGGAGGGGSASSAGGNGGSGIVIIRYYGG
jgi:hypothetical protein